MSLFDDDDWSRFAEPCPSSGSTLPPPPGPLSAPGDTETDEALLDRMLACRANDVPSWDILDGLEACDEEDP